MNKRDLLGRLEAACERCKHDLDHEGEAEFRAWMIHLDYLLDAARVRDAFIRSTPRVIAKTDPPLAEDLRQLLAEALAAIGRPKAEQHDDAVPLDDGGPGRA